MTVFGKIVDMFSPKSEKPNSARRAELIAELRSIDEDLHKHAYIGFLPDFVTPWWVIETSKLLTRSFLPQLSKSTKTLIQRELYGSFDPKSDVSCAEFIVRSMQFGDGLSELNRLRPDSLDFSNHFIFHMFTQETARAVRRTLDYTPYFPYTTYDLFHMHIAVEDRLPSLMMIEVSLAGRYDLEEAIVGLRALSAKIPEYAQILRYAEARLKFLTGAQVDYIVALERKRRVLSEIAVIDKKRALKFLIPPTRHLGETEIALNWLADRWPIDPFVETLTPQRMKQARLSSVYAGPLPSFVTRAWIKDNFNLPPVATMQHLVDRWSEGTGHVLPIPPINNEDDIADTLLLLMRFRGQIRAFFEFDNSFIDPLLARLERKLCNKSVETALSQRAELAPPFAITEHDLSLFKEYSPLKVYYDNTIKFLRDDSILIAERLFIDAVFEIDIYSVSVFCLKFKHPNISEVEFFVDALRTSYRHRKSFALDTEVMRKFSEIGLCLRPFALEDYASIISEPALPSVSMALPANWIKTNISLNTQQRNALNALRAEINSILGENDFWPASKMDMPAICGLLQKIADRHPALFSALLLHIDGSKALRNSKYFAERPVSIPKTALFRNPDRSIPNGNLQVLALYANVDEAVTYGTWRALICPHYSLELAAYLAKLQDLNAFIKERRQYVTWFLERDPVSKNKIFDDLRVVFNAGEQIVDTVVETDPVTGIKVGPALIIGEPAYDAYVETTLLPTVPSASDNETAIAPSPAVDQPLPDPSPCESELNTDSFLENVMIISKPPIDEIAIPHIETPAAPSVSSFNSPLCEALSSIRLSAASCIDTLAIEDLSAFKTHFAVLSSFFSEAQTLADNLSTEIDNLTLLRRASALGETVAVLSEQLEHPVDLSDLPHAGLIAPEAASEAEQSLASGEDQSKSASTALDESISIQGKMATAKTQEMLALVPTYSLKVGDAQASLRSSVAFLNRAISFLSPIGSSSSVNQSIAPAVAPEFCATTSAHEAPIASLQPDLDDAVVVTDLQTPSHERLQETLEPAPTNLEAKCLTADIAEPSGEVIEAAVAHTIERARINERLENLMIDGRFGLAFHLARSAEDAAPQHSLIVSSDEARIAALAGHLQHTVLLNNPSLVSSWVEAGHAANAAIQIDPNRDRQTWRYLALLPIFTELAIFFPLQSNPSDLLRPLSFLPGDFGQAVKDLYAALTDLKTTDNHFTRILIAEATGEIDTAGNAEKCRSDMLAKIDHFSRQDLGFLLAMQVRNHLIGSNGEVGKLKAALKDEKTAEAGVRQFIDRVKDRNSIERLVSESEKAASTLGKRIVGWAKDNHVTFFTQLHSLATSYLANVEAKRNATKRSGKTDLRNVALKITRALAKMIKAAEELSPKDDKLGRSSTPLAKRLRLLASYFDGNNVEADSAAMLQATHADLALFSNLDYGVSWLPSPYNPSLIMSSILAANLPILPDAPDLRDAKFAEIFQHRLDRHSFAGARLMLDAASFFGISCDLVQNLEIKAEAALRKSQQHFKEEISTTRQFVDRVHRFGSLRYGTDSDTASRLIESVATIEGIPLPMLIGPEERVDDIITSSIGDISVALIELTAIRKDAEALLVEPRERLLERIAEIETEGGTPKLVDSLKNLCLTDDLLTAEEFIDEAVKTGALPVLRERNWRFEEFMSTVLPAWEKAKTEDLAKLTSALNDGHDFVGLKLGELSDTRRQEIKNGLISFRSLFRLQINDRFEEELAKFFIAMNFTVQETEKSSATSVQHKRWVGDFRLSFAKDPESLLLPDFGSQAGGWYTVIAVPGMLSEADIDLICSDTTHPVLLVVGDTISAKSRRHFQVKNVESERRVILIDNASVLYTLAQPETRALTLIELGQPFSFAKPYRDHGRAEVPLEMFVGRRSYIQSVTSLEGSNIVYGGRRMGKTALLRHIETTRNQPATGMLVSYLDIQQIGKPSDPAHKVWSAIAAKLPEVFGPNCPSDSRRVVEGIRSWLNEHAQRRILLLLDESEDFVRSDAANGDVEILELQRLMTDTKRRFKFVLSGLQNVTRLAQTGNTPVKQISSNPCRIGSLAGAEMSDAQELVIRPLAALGLKIDQTHVWRVLSHANYYPILVQVYAEHLLDMAIKHIKSTGEALTHITLDMVDQTLNDHTVQSSVLRIFDFTLSIDERYKLIAYVVASLSIQSENYGRNYKGFKTGDIADFASSYWPGGFDDRNRTSLFDALLDEMEGLGIVTRTGRDLWTLRSTSVMRLLGDQAKVSKELDRFETLPAPIEFDPKSHRREIDIQRPGTPNERVPSPLTLKQERDLLLSNVRVNIVLGLPIAGYSDVPLALRTALSSHAETEDCEMRFPSVKTLSHLIEEVKSDRTVGRKKIIYVIGSSMDWTAEWVKDIAALKQFGSPNSRVIFVGGPQHAYSIAENRPVQSLISRSFINMMPLEAWSHSFTNTMMKHNGTDHLSSYSIDQFDEMLGGWNVPMWDLTKASKTKAVQKILSDHGKRDILKLPKAVADTFGFLIGLGGVPMTTTEIDGYIDMDDVISKLGIDGETFVQIGFDLGLLRRFINRPPNEAVKITHGPTRFAAHVFGTVQS